MIYLYVSTIKPKWIFLTSVARHLTSPLTRHLSGTATATAEGTTCCPQCFEHGEQVSQIEWQHQYGGFLKLGYP